MHVCVSVSPFFHISCFALADVFMVFVIIATSVCSQRKRRLCAPIFAAPLHLHHLHHFTSYNFLFAPHISCCLLLVAAMLAVALFNCNILASARLLLSFFLPDWRLQRFFSLRLVSRYSTLPVCVPFRHFQRLISVRRCLLYDMRICVY